MPLTSTELHDLYGELRALNERLFPQHAEVAYHALAGAMHAAHDARDIAAVEAIADVAERQTQALGDADPPTGGTANHVACSAVRIYTTLAQQSRVIAETLRAQALLKEISRRPV